MMIFVTHALMAKTNFQKPKDSSSVVETNKQLMTSDMYILSLRLFNICTESRGPETVETNS